MEETPDPRLEDQGLIYFYLLFTVLSRANRFTVKSLCPNLQKGNNVT